MENKKKLILIVIIILIVILSVFFTWVYFQNSIDILQPKENLEFEVGSNILVKDLIEKNDKIKIKNANEIIDTTNVGEKNIKVIYIYRKKERNIDLSFVVKDTIAPVIVFEKELITNVGEDIDLLKNVTVSDNSQNKIDVIVEGEYDINNAGEYNLKYVAIDNSNNRTEENFILKVENKKQIYSYPKLPVPANLKELIGTTNNGYNIYKINNSYYIDDYLIVNKSYPLASDYIPENTYKNSFGITNQCASCINKTAYKAFLDMKQVASSLGLKIWIQSGYRPYSLQVTLYNKYVERDGKEQADTYSSRPGYSEHQTGLSFDLNSISDSFANTKEGKWINENAYKYGFIIRFPKGKEEQTGYKYESWHLRYVGTELATKLYNNGNWISLEEYFGIRSVYE